MKSYALFFVCLIGKLSNMILNLSKNIFIQLLLMLCQKPLMKKSIAQINKTAKNWEWAPFAVNQRKFKRPKQWGGPYIMNVGVRSIRGTIAVGTPTEGAYQIWAPLESSCSWPPKFWPHNNGGRNFEVNKWSLYGNQQTPLDLLIPKQARTSKSDQN